MDFTQEKIFPHRHSGFIISLWNSKKSHLHHTENLIHCPWVELNICCAIKPDHVKSLRSEHLSLFEDLEYQQTFYVDKLNESGKNHTANVFFSIFNQYSRTFWDDLFPCTLCYSISHCNRGCLFSNTASMRAWSHQNSVLLCVNLRRWSCLYQANQQPLTSRGRGSLQ